MSTFATLDYSIRPNKNIERKLFVEILRALAPQFDVSTYRYVGMGARWFADFALFHRELKIEKMISIERCGNAGRARFNRPYDCISVEEGDSTVVLPTIDWTALPSIVWLDYDSDLHGPVLKDAGIVLPELTSGSIFLATVNAAVQQLSADAQNPAPASKLEKLRELVGELVAPDLPLERLTTAKFPLLVAEILTDHFRHQVRNSGTGLEYMPLVHFAYRDGAQMVTVGGMVADTKDKTKIGTCTSLWQLPAVTTTTPFEISVPTLTPKEKAALDRLLPASTRLTEADVQASTGFPISQKHIDAYSSFYRLYPVFGEIFA
ncbi:MAG: hypothetical protein H6926_02500 [Chromatiales bacterium]|nr:hypothetical protein [Chromatiales bacterium]